MIYCIISNKSNREIFPIREDKQEKIEVHVAGFCFRLKGKRVQLLVGKRRKDRDLFPSKWECGGGQVKKNENFEEAMRRQYYEEFGIRVNVLSPIFSYEILRPNGPKIPGIKFLCKSIDNGNEDIILNKREFSEYKWVSERQCLKLNLITGVISQTKAAFRYIRAKQNLLGPAMLPVEKTLCVAQYIGLRNWKKFLSFLGW
ncbi:MAG: NUDIX domain-containing protein [Nanoarchaeota archaeon]|nr:NUDIX domain-containing protein [Nanoarchaeota archaeon]MBU1028485.1 NUDIX domain-containing protein [Nanoarchaeota archaeon]